MSDTVGDTLFDQALYGDALPTLTQAQRKRVQENPPEELRYECTQDISTKVKLERPTAEYNGSSTLLMKHAKDDFRRHREQRQQLRDRLTQKRTTTPTVANRIDSVVHGDLTDDESNDEIEDDMRISNFVAALGKSTKNVKDDRSSICNENDEDNLHARMPVTIERKLSMERRRSNFKSRASSIQSRCLSLHSRCSSLLSMTEDMTDDFTDIASAHASTSIESQKW